jgi:hypothetical protein
MLFHKDDCVEPAFQEAANQIGITLGERGTGENRVEFDRANVM